MAGVTIYECKICHQRSSNMYPAQQHIIAHQGVTFECHICGKKFTTGLYTASHLKHHLNPWYIISPQGDRYKLVEFKPHMWKGILHMLSTFGKKIYFFNYRWCLHLSIRRDVWVHKSKANQTKFKRNDFENISFGHSQMNNPTKSYQGMNRTNKRSTKKNPIQTGKRAEGCKSAMIAICNDWIMLPHLAKNVPLYCHTLVAAEAVKAYLRDKVGALQQRQNNDVHNTLEDCHPTLDNVISELLPELSDHNIWYNSTKQFENKKLFYDSTSIRNNKKSLK